jgi:hypothetical protein
VDKVAEMVKQHKKTLCAGKIVWVLPNGQCTTGFSYAVRLWKEYYAIFN